MMRAARRNWSARIVRATLATPIDSPSAVSTASLAVFESQNLPKTSCLLMGKRRSQSDLGLRETCR
jgi:hypothetical protein